MVAVLLSLLLLLVGSLGCQSSSVTGLQQILAPDTIGCLFEWRFQADSFQLGSAGSGSSGWRLINPTPLCPLIADALTVTPPECVNLGGGKKCAEPSIREDTAPKDGAVGFQETYSALACAWEGGSDACRNEPPAVKNVSPLRSAIVLPGPLDPVLERAFSHRTPFLHSDPQPENVKNQLGDKVSHFGLFFDSGSHVPKKFVRSKENGLEAATIENDWVVERVSRELVGSGAHRHLVSKVVLTPGRGIVSGRGPVGSVALVEALPSGVYADKFELQRMAFDKVASVASVFGPVDIERPAPECTQSLVVAYSRSVETPERQLEASFVVPLHSRYPAVASGEPELHGDFHHTTVEIGLPIYVLWTDSPGLFTEEELRMHDGWRHATWQEEFVKSGTRQEVSEKDVGLKAGWRKDVVARWKVSHARGEHAAVVQFGTLFVCFVATAYLMFVVMMKA